MPNAHLVDSTITNYTHTNPLIRVCVPVGVGYNSDPDQVQAVILEVARACPDIESYPAPEVWFTGFGESALNFELLVWLNVRQTNGGQVKSALHFGLFRAFKGAGIELPFPQRDLHLRSGSPWAGLLKLTDEAKGAEEGSRPGDSDPAPPDSDE